MSISEYISTFGVIAVAAFLVYKEYRSGNSSINAQVVANYKTLDEQQKSKIKSQEEAIAKYQADFAEVKTAMSKMKEDFANQIGQLQGEIASKDKHIAELTQTILNRNPELEVLLKEIRDFMKNIYDQNKYQTGILEEAKLRNDGIDHATENEQGHVLRKADNA